MFIICESKYMTTIPRPPRPTFMQLRTFIAVARLGGVTRAAAALHLSQPAVSNHLRELAQAAGSELVAPAGRGLRLTDAGQALLEAAEAMFAAWRGFEETADALQGLRRGLLRIAGVSTTEYFIARMLQPFLAAHPGMAVDLAVDNRDTVIARLRAEQVELAVMMMPPAGLPLHTLPFLDNPLVVIGPLDHPWAARRRVPVTRLAEEALVLREAGSGTRAAAMAHLQARGLRVEPRLTLGSNEAVKHAVAAGLGLGVVSRHTLADDPAREGLALLPVAGFPIRRRWQLVWRRDRRLSLTAGTFLDYVRAHVQPHAPRLPADRSGA